MSHAAVASFYDASPAFVLGAMLPDFFGMLDIKASATSAELGRGIAFHHASDAAFHDAPAFLSLTREACKELSALGLPKGPARAVAHIGVELLLDPVILSRPGARNAYARALEFATVLNDELSLGKDEARRLQDLARLLLARRLASPEDLQHVVARIRRTLAERPRLALDDAMEAAVRKWVVGVQPRVVGCSSDVIRQVLSKLDDQGFGRAQREAAVP